MKKTKNIGGLKVRQILLVGAFFLFPGLVVASDGEQPPDGGFKKLLKITGYYSPLPDQGRYVRGSYEADIRLNGRGTNGADGTEVYPGILAAPYTYAFGTQIFIPGLGLGTVHDRGGAIVPAGMRGQSHDRVDVWMGRGESGLSRALHWGVRLVEAVVYPNGSGFTDNFSFSGIAQADLSHLPTGFLKNSVKKDASNSAVREFQEQLREMGYFQGKITGHYGAETEQAILDFQLSNRVIASAQEGGAGIFGPRTKRAFLLAITRLEQEKLEQIAHLSRLLPAGLSDGSHGKVVEHVQEVLADLGYYNGQVHGTYDDQTTEAVLQFQIDHDIVRSAGDFGAGVFGPQTQSALFHLFSVRESTLEETDHDIQMESVQIAAFAVEPELIEETSDSELQLEIPAPSALSKQFPTPGTVPDTAVAGNTTAQKAMISASFEADDQ